MILYPSVALRKESVDRNCWRYHNRLPSIPVALRKESVDRNTACRICGHHVIVALRKESVDRNMGVGTTRDSLGVSLSARRAWIEIFWYSSRMIISVLSLSARRAWIEIAVPRLPWWLPPSLSARRAWIEITGQQSKTSTEVALRKESVDRNLLRGCCDSIFERSLSARRAWIEIVGGAIAAYPVFPVALRKESVDRNIGAS